MKWARAKAATRQQGGQQRAREVDIPLPLRGVNSEAADAITSGAYAGVLKNWESNGSYLEFRPPFSQSEIGGSVSQRIVFEYGAESKYIKVDRLGLTTQGGASLSRVSAPPMDSAFISNQAILVDGESDPVRFDGTGFLPSSFSTTTGLTQDQFTGIVAHQDRPFFWKFGDNLDFYYGDVGAVTGAVTRFPLGRLGNINGTIFCMKSLTVDAGNGLNDMLAIFTTTGQMVVYEGTNPGDTSAWGQVARIQIARPVSKWAFAPVGSDLWVLTNAGVISVQDSLRQSQLALVSGISSAIQTDLRNDVLEGGTWSMHVSDDAQRIIVNRVFNNTSSQWIFHPKTKAWFKADYPARWWHNFGQETTFTGLDGGLYRLASDDRESIKSVLETSWLPAPGAGTMTYLRPTIIANGPIRATISVFTDHNETSLDSTEAQHVVTLNPENLDDRVAMSDIIAVDAGGATCFKIRMEIKSKWARLVSMKAGIL